jgi:hypothetical protein
MSDDGNVDNNEYNGSDLPDKENLYPWQCTVLDILNQEPGTRKIHWFWESKGNTGKTMFAKYLAYHHNALYFNGQNYSEIMKIIYMARKEIKIVIMDIPRIKEKKPPYNAIESIKNGLIIHQSRSKFINSPHIIVFCSKSPDINKFSKDRWNIKKINNDTLNLEDDNTTSQVERRINNVPFFTGENEGQYYDNLVEL